MITSFLLSLAGLAISGYLTYAHFQPRAMVCADSGVVNCGLVTTSAQSYFLGVPVAVLGLVQYGAMTALTSPWAWRSPLYALHVARAALAAVGMGFVLWLVAAELLIIDHICLWCTGVHVVTFALLVVLARVAPAQLGWVATGGSGSDARAR
ncbi:MAG: vitamin K epoxide reductase family protein [Acidobacteriota bacterium]|nr:vitamin K epoxide reductase family protein [Acidobacteriota bacterium]